jgi:hypothetical protein
MYHHSESPEVINATIAERERTVATHRAQREARRLLSRDEDAVANPTPSLTERLLQRLRPAARMHRQPGH